VKSKLVLVLMLSIAPSWANGIAVRQWFENLLTLSGNPAAANEDQFFSLVNEGTIGQLSASEINEILPLAKRCLPSKSPEVRRYGMLLIMAVTMREDSAALLGPYLNDLEEIASAPADNLRTGAYYVLGHTNPNPVPKAVAFLVSRLGDQNNSPSENLIIAASLLKSSDDPGVIHKVCNFADGDLDRSVKSGLLAQLGLLRTREGEELAFIGRSLDNKDGYIRLAAVESVMKLDSDVRGSFFDQLSRIASDPKESSEIRSRAASVLR
jgi:hypothetical protein